MDKELLKGESKKVIEKLDQYIDTYHNKKGYMPEAVTISDRQYGALRTEAKRNAVFREALSEAKYRGVTLRRTH